MVLLLVLLIFCWGASADPYSFVFNDGFKSGELQLDGGAHIPSNGLLALFPRDPKCDVCVSQAFYPTPFVLKNSFSAAFSFSTHFVFQMGTSIQNAGMAFVLAPTTTLHGDFRNLGLLDSPDEMYYPNQTITAIPNDNSSNHIIAVHLVGYNGYGLGFHDVGIDVNATTPVDGIIPGYDDYFRQSHPLKLLSDQPLHARVFYVDGTITVQLNPFDETRWWSNLTSHKLDLSDIVNRNMYVGFVRVSKLILIQGDDRKTSNP